MNLPQLELVLKAVTADLCGHQGRQGQLSMSWLSLPVDEIVDRVRNGHVVDPENKLKLFQGTQSEIALRGRLEIVCKKLGLPWGDPETLSAYDGRLTGHTDGSIDGHVVEIKTVPNVDILNRLKSDGRVPFKVFSQVSAYMLWGSHKRAVVIYETRAEGALWFCECLPNKRVEGELKEKAEKVLEIVHGRS